MSNIIVISKTQKIIVNSKTSSIKVGSTLQQPITINSPVSSVSVINAGPQGPTGPQGVPGSADGEVFRYVHTQGVAATSWVVNHNLGGYPSITLLDYLGEEFYANVNYPNANQAIVTLTVPDIGTANCS